MELRHKPELESGPQLPGTLSNGYATDDLPADFLTEDATATHSALRPRGDEAPAAAAELPSRRPRAWPVAAGCAVHGRVGAGGTPWGGEGPHPTSGGGLVPAREREVRLRVSGTLSLLFWISRRQRSGVLRGEYGLG